MFTPEPMPSIRCDFLLDSPRRSRCWHSPAVRRLRLGIGQRHPYRPTIAGDNREAGTRRSKGAIVTRAQRLANLASGNTDVAVIDDEREITVRVYGDMAVVQNLSTLHGRFDGVPTDTDLRGTFVWVRRDGRWQLVTNQLTAVASPSS